MAVRKTVIHMWALFRGSSQIGVYRGRNKEPHFIVCGAHVSDLDIDKLREYMDGVDWCDRGSPGWITPQLRCDDFLTDSARRRMEAVWACR